MQNAHGMRAISRMSGIRTDKMLSTMSIRATIAAALLVQCTAED